MSTYCRGCGQHFRLLGATHQRKAGIGAIFGFSKKPATSPVPSRQTPPQRLPAVPYQLTGVNEQKQSVASTGRMKMGESPTMVRDVRRVECFDCHASHRASRSATSTQCPECSAYIDLKDLHITERTTLRIRTRGDVEVTKKGALLGSSIHCGNLTLHGAVSGSIYASGDVDIHSDLKIIGEIRCRRLIIHKKCSVQCLQPVHVISAEIHGHLIGAIHAGQSLQLTRTGVLEGATHTGTISMEPGATLNGQVKCQSERASRRRPEINPTTVLSDSILSAAAVI